MSTPSIKTKVALEGEKEYRQALSEINSGLKVLSSEMKLATAQFVENADGIEALTAKGDILERQMLTQKEKIDTLREALQKSAEAYGESDTRTAKWQVSLNNAEAELVKMERELRNNQEAVKKAGNAYDDMSDAFGDSEKAGKSLGEMVENLAGKLGVNLPDGAKEALDALGDVDAKTALLAGSAAAAAAAIVKIEQALIGITTERAAAATTLANIAQTINMDVEATQQWDYVLKTVGSSIEEAQGDLSAFQEKIMEANTGTGEAAEMFAKLGVNVADQSGKLRDTESVLLDTINALQLMADETERNAISSTLLGGTGEKLIPIYNQSAEALQYLLDRKHELGILTGDEIEALKDVSEALLEYEERVASAKDMVAAEFAPALEEFYEKAGIGIQSLGEAVTNSGLVSFLGSLLELVSSLIPLLDAFNVIAGDIAPVIDGITFSIRGLSDALSIVTETLSKISSITSVLIPSKNSPSIGVLDVFGYLGTLFNSFASVSDLRRNSSGDYNYDGGYTWVGENGPELAYLPQGTRIFSNQESRSMGGDTFYVTIDAKNVKEFNDIVEMAKAKRRKDRMG